MNQITIQIREVVAAMSWLEAVAVLTALVYIYFVTKENMLCWPAALISETIFVAICIQAQIYAETFLHAYYWLMAIYGLWAWKGKRGNRKELPITLWSMKSHALILISGSLLVGFTGFYLSTNTNAALPYLDSFTTVFSLIATYMVTRKVLENWLYWIIIDGASIYLYGSRELYLAAILSFLYAVISIFGYTNWKKKIKRQA